MVGHCANHDNVVHTTHSQQNKLRHKTDNDSDNCSDNHTINYTTDHNHPNHTNHYPITHSQSK